MNKLRSPLKGSEAIAERDLRNWRLLGAFEEALERVFSRARLHPSLADPQRKLSYGRYLSLFLFGLFNPVVESMRGLCAVSALPRVQREVCGRRIALGSFSEMQHLLDPLLLQEVFRDLVAQAGPERPPPGDLAHLNLIAQDGSLWRALPRMVWAQYVAGRSGQAKGVRLHLRLHLISGQAQQALIQCGKSCERQALRQMCQPGQINVADRLYTEDYSLFEDIGQKGGFFVLRLRRNAIIHVQSELALSEEDRAAGVLRHLWATLGGDNVQRTQRLRVVEIASRQEPLLLVTNLPLEQASAALVGLIYRKRWDIELFFRWLKCILGCRHFFAESAQGVAIQLYLALIASVLLQYYAGRRPTKRMLELIQFYLMGWATAEELVELLAQQAANSSSRKKA